LSEKLTAISTGATRLWSGAAGLSFRTGILLGVPDLALNSNKRHLQKNAIYDAILLAAAIDQP